MLLFLVLLAWSVREVIGGFLRGSRGLLKIEPTVRPRLPVHAIRSRRGVLAVSYYGTKATRCCTKGLPLARNQSEWVIVTPDSDIHYELFRTDVSRVIVLPDGGVRPPLIDPVYGFAEAVGVEAARGLIADGLNEAIRRGVELGAAPPEHSLLVTWDGQKVPLRTPLGSGADARMDDRIGDPRDAHSGDATPRGPALDPFR